MDIFNQNGDVYDTFGEWIGSFLEGEKYVICQFTGAFDLNRLKIFNNDIIRLEYVPGLPSTGYTDLVKYLHVQYSSFHAHYSAYDSEGCPYSVGFSGSAVKSFEVVGSYLKNPEMLELKD